MGYAKYFFTHSATLIRLLLFIAILSFDFSSIYAQGVKISENENSVQTVAPSAILELESTSKGLLISRVADTNDVVSPVAGLLVYDEGDETVYFRSRTRWISANSPSLALGITEVLRNNNDANNNDILGVDSIAVSSINLPTTKNLDALTGQEKVLLQTQDGTLRPIDISVFFSPRVFKKELKPTSTEAPNLASATNDIDRTIFYAYRAYGVRADQIELKFVEKAAAGRGALANSIYGSVTSEPNLILELPDGVRIDYLYVAASNRAFSTNIKTSPSSRAMRFHILHTENDTTRFNKTKLVRTSKTVTSDHSFLRDFYMPHFKVVLAPEANTFSPTNQASHTGIGYVDDWVAPSLNRKPVNTAETVAYKVTYDHDNNAGTADREEEVSILTSQRGISPSPTAAPTPSDLSNVTPLGDHPMVHAQYIYSDQKRTIIGLNYMIRHHGFSDFTNEALRFSVFF